MHPAYSVIFFTTATGAGYGLLALFGLAVAFGYLPPDFWLGFIGLGIAITLITAGLLSSAGHLGHPERAWRAFSQWRSSWLSREGVASVATYLPAAVFGIGWVFLGRSDAVIAGAGVLAAVGALLTVSCTAMIYASLKPIAEWNSRFTLPGYLVFAAMTGTVLFNAILQAFGLGASGLILAAIALTIVGWSWKEATWRYNADLPMAATAGSATGLGNGTVRSVEWPHTEANYLLKEMGYRIARKHANRLRNIARVTAFVVPVVLLAAALIAQPVLAVVLSVLAFVSQMVGMVVERWLFFAEARHTVTLYYR